MTRGFDVRSSPAALLAVLTSVVLVGIGGLHLYWGIGGFWPGHDEASLVDMVMGMPAGTPVPPLWACLVVVVLLMVPVVSALGVAGFLKGSRPAWFRWLMFAGLWGSVLVFAARGVSTYVSPLVESARGTAFYDLDRVIYAPLCLALAASLAAVWFLAEIRQTRDRAAT